ncbi:MAG: hypothetical protein Q9220_002503 [cf. Caloplaca sp. 1 TL-2023]
MLRHGSIFRAINGQQARKGVAGRCRYSLNVPGKPQDPQVDNLGRALVDDFATIRSKYPHGLLGFDELRLAGSFLPGVHYWRGIAEALNKNGIEVITTSVPAPSSIEERAAKLSSDIAAKAEGKSVNIIAGLDSRYMLSQLKPANVSVTSLTTIASPHRETNLPRVYGAFQKLQIPTGAFSQLTRQYMREEFNPRTPDREGVRYFSYGASMDPPLWSAFRLPHRIVSNEEGPNDGLVSVESSKWGQYKGTLVNVSHLDLINWTNRLRWLVWELTGNKRK